MKGKWRKRRHWAAEKLTGRWGRKRRGNETPGGWEPGMLPEDGGGDDGYDGYYDDILPDDAGRPAEGLDRELLKRVALVVGGMLLAAAVCIAIMYLV